MNREQAKETIKRDIPCTDYLEKSKSGLYCCPICSSGHGSNGTGAVKYYPDTNTWYCHACNEGGDVIDAYRAANGCDYNDALLYLAARAGINIDQRPTAADDFKTDAIERPQSDFISEKDTQHSQQTKAPQNANTGRTGQTADFTAYYEYCRGNLNDPAAVSYLAGRGISIDTASSCGIGYDPAADPAAAPGAMGNEYKPHPAPRIIIPCSRSHYVARSIDPNTPTEYKAMNPNTQKGGGSVSLFIASELCRGADVVFITEGAFDALSFLEAGAAAIALNSKGNGKLLVQALQHQPAKAAFVIVPDNDSDPKTAADTMKRANDLNNDLQGMGYNSIVYNVAGDYHDANDALQADRAAFMKRITAAVDELNRDYLTDFLEKVQTEAYKPHPTGLNFFDNLLGGGIVNQTLLLLLAAPAAGKTTLIQQLAEAMAANQRPVVYLNFEMSREQMLSKAISAKLYKNGGDKSMTGILQGYKWTDDERAAITRIVDDYRRTNYPYIRYNPPGASSELTQLLSYLKATGDAAKAADRQAPAVVVDYLHLITSSDKLDTAELIKAAIKGLHDYAVNYDTFVIAIAAVNREAMKDGRITLNSGRDSSGIEFTGDYILSLNYADLESKKVKTKDIEAVSEMQNQSKRLMVLRVLKNRAGRQGNDTKLMFDAVHNIFYGTCDEFIPAAGFTMDDGLPAFDDDSDIVMTL